MQLSNACEHDNDYGLVFYPSNAVKRNPMLTFFYLFDCVWNAPTQHPLMGFDFVNRTFQFCF